jgi:sarcosine oxidase subunit beta
VKRYSIFSLIRNALSFHDGWERVWRSPDPRPEYDVVIIGGGGHGLGCAYYLAKDHGLTNVAVLEKGWLGGGNTGRNTMTIRSNYIRDVSVPFHDYSIELYRQLSQELNFNIMFSQRGMVTLIQSAASSRDAMRRANTMHIYGADYRVLSVAAVKKMLPILATPANARFPVIGGVYQPRAGIARHDAVAWGYARMADAMGVQVIQNCEVTGIDRVDNRVVGVRTTRGAIKAKKIGIATAGHNSVVAAMAGLRLPIETKPLQAFVSDPVKPILEPIVVCGGYGAYLMQSDKGEIVVGGAEDPYPSYQQRGTYAITEEIVAGMVETFPIFKRMRLMRQWGGMVELIPDSTPIIGKTPVEGLTIDIAGAGGFKTIPVAAKCHAHVIATGRQHELARGYGLDRYEKGRLVLETGVGSRDLRRV